MTLPRKRPRYDGWLASATRISISTATGLNSGERLPCRTVNINKSARKQWRGIAAETDAAIDVTMIAPSTASVNDHSKYPTESSLAHAILASITTVVRGNFRILLRYWNFAAWGTVGWPVNYFSSCVIDLERWRFRRLEEWIVQYVNSLHFIFVAPVFHRSLSPLVFKLKKLRLKLMGFNIIAWDLTLKRTEYLLISIWHSRHIIVNLYFLRSILWSMRRM